MLPAHHPCVVCKASVREPGLPCLKLSQVPTALTSPGLIDVAANSVLGLFVCGCLFGLATMLQVFPSQCSISVWLKPGGGCAASPTAQTSLLERAVTIRTLHNLPDRALSKRLLSGRNSDNHHKNANKPYHKVAYSYHVIFSFDINSLTNRKRVTAIYRR